MFFSRGEAPKSRDRPWAAESKHPVPPFIGGKVLAFVYLIWSQCFHVANEAGQTPVDNLRPDCSSTQDPESIENSGRQHIFQLNVLIKISAVQNVSRRGSRILVRGAQQSFDLRGPSAQNLLKIGFFSLKIARNLHDFDEIWGARGARAPRAPWIRCWCHQAGLPCPDSGRQLPSASSACLYMCCANPNCRPPVSATLYTCCVWPVEEISAYR